MSLKNSSRILHSEENGVHVIGFPKDDKGVANQEFVRQFFALDFLKSTAAMNPLVIDLAGVVSLDSASLGPLVQKFRDLQDHQGKMALANVKSPALREIFALTRFDKVFAIFGTREEAVSAVAAK